MEQPAFYRFSLSQHDNIYTLIAESHGGAEWWVVGYLERLVELPIWDSAEALRLRAAREADRKH